MLQWHSFLAIGGRSHDSREPVPPTTNDCHRHFSLLTRYLDRISRLGTGRRREKPFRAAPHEMYPGRSDRTAVCRSHCSRRSRDRRTTGLRLSISVHYGSSTKVKQFAPAGDPSYESCWHTLTEAHAPMLKRTDTVMDVIWPSTGPLVFFGDDLPRAPASAFVMDVLGYLAPWKRPAGHRASAAIRFQPVRSVSRQRQSSEGPTTLVQLSVEYHDPLTSPVTYAAGNVKWTNTIKRPRKSLKSVTTQWVVFTGLKRYGFPGDAAVFNLPVASDPEALGMVAEKIPFATESSRALPDSLNWWGPDDQPGTLTAAAARAASFPDLRDRVALLNRVLLIDPQQPDALTVLTRHLYSVLLHEGRIAIS